MSQFDWFAIAGCLYRNGGTEDEILKIQINAIPENTNKATNYGLHVFQGNLGEFTFRMCSEFIVCLFMLTVKYQFYSQFRLVFQSKKKLKLA